MTTKGHVFTTAAEIGDSLHHTHVGLMSHIPRVDDPRIAAAAQNAFARYQAAMMALVVEANRADV